MVEFINSSFSVSFGKTEQAEKTSKAENSTESDKAADSSASYSKYDTVSISAEGAEYVRNAAASNEEQSLSDTTQQAATSSSSADALTVSEDADGDTTDDLSEYSDTELKLMMYTGEISRSEYETEMTERGTDAAAEE